MLLCQEFVSEDDNTFDYSWIREDWKHLKSHKASNRNFIIYHDFVDHIDTDSNTMSGEIKALGRLYFRDGRAQLKTDKELPNILFLYNSVFRKLWNNQTRYIQDTNVTFRDIDNQGKHYPAGLTFSELLLGHKLVPRTIYNLDTVEHELHNKFINDSMYIFYSLRCNLQSEMLNWQTEHKKDHLQYFYKDIVSAKDVFGLVFRPSELLELFERVFGVFLEGYRSAKVFYKDMKIEESKQIILNNLNTIEQHTSKSTTYAPEKKSFVLTLDSKYKLSLQPL